MRNEELRLDADQVEQAMRWRLILGRFSDDQLGFGHLQQRAMPGTLDGVQGLGGLFAEAQQMDVPLEYVYDREYAARAHRQAGGGDSRGLSVPMWLNRVRSLFPEEAVHILENDALTRYGMTELITDPEILRRAQPSEELLKAILQFKHRMHGPVLEAARDVVKAVVAQLADKIKSECYSALHGVLEPEQRPPRPTFRNTDWKRTIQRNLKNYDRQGDRLIIDRVFYKHRQKYKSPWHIIIAVDQSGSMTDSLIHSSVMAAIFASLPSVEVSLVLWDTRYVDVSRHVSDPLEVLMSCQLGGGTDMWPAMQYCAGLIRNPQRTIFVLLSDWYIFDKQQQCLAMAQKLREDGVMGVGLSALDSQCKPIYDEAFAKQLAGCGWFVAALTPKKLAEHIGKIVA
ncbi:MAG: VWA domain-containing protein [Myxococcales bacterium]|nr:VWA domain-containing protein [Polyangiaceae bacterium]MDW8251103.1 VWA domain-containing protein [Myxococcales bacterium]